MSDTIPATSDGAALAVLASLPPDSPICVALRQHFDLYGHDVAGDIEALPSRFQKTILSAGRLLMMLEHGHSVSGTSNAPPLRNAVMMVRSDVEFVLMSEQATFGADGAYGCSEITKLAQSHPALTFCVREEAADDSGAPQAVRFWESLFKFFRRSKPREDFRGKQKLVPVGYAIFKWGEQTMNVLTAGIFEGYRGHGYGQGIVARLLSRGFDKGGKGLDFDHKHTFLYTFERMQGYCDAVLDEKDMSVDAFARGIQRIARCLDELPDGRFRDELRLHFGPAFDSADDANLPQQKNALSNARNSLVALLHVFGSKDYCGTDVLRSGGNPDIGISQLPSGGDAANLLRRMIPMVSGGNHYEDRAEEKLLTANVGGETVGVVSFVERTVVPRGRLLVPVRYGKAHGNPVTGIEPALAAALLEMCRTGSMDGIFLPGWLRKKERENDRNAHVA